MAEEQKTGNSPTVINGRCSVCMAAGEKSTVTAGMSTRTCMAWSQYYDSDGVWHDDDPNKTTTQWRCSRGHDLVTVE